jgi:hypothetical protein
LSQQFVDAKNVGALTQLAKSIIDYAKSNRQMDLDWKKHMVSQIAPHTKAADEVVKSFAEMLRKVINDEGKNSKVVGIIEKIASSNMAGEQQYELVKEAMKESTSTPWWWRFLLVVLAIILFPITIIIIIVAIGEAVRTGRTPTWLEGLRGRKI